MTSKCQWNFPDWDNKPHSINQHFYQHFYQSIKDLELRVTRQISGASGHNWFCYLNSLQRINKSSSGLGLDIQGLSCSVFLERDNWFNIGNLLQCTWVLIGLKHMLTDHLEFNHLGSYPVHECYTACLLKVDSFLKAFWFSGPSMHWTPQYKWKYLDCGA